MSNAVESFIPFLSSIELIKAEAVLSYFLLRNLNCPDEWVFFSFKNSIFNQNLQPSKSLLRSNIQSTISFSSIFMEFSKISQAFPFH